MKIINRKECPPEALEGSTAADRHTTWPLMQTLAIKDIDN